MWLPLTTKCKQYFCKKPFPDFIGVRLIKSLTMASPKNVILLSCGSFNPITVMHLDLFHIAKAYLENELKGYRVLQGIISPVNNKYMHKKNLADSELRIQMCKLAIGSSSTHSWIKVDDYESKQKRWMRTVEVLRHYQSQFNDGNKSGQRTHVILLCGSDYIDSFNVPNLWSDEDLEEIASKFGIVCVPRSGWDPEKIVSSHKILKRNMSKVLIVKTAVPKDISSTNVRERIKNNQDVGNLIEKAVHEFIVKHNLYKS